MTDETDKLAELYQAVPLSLVDEPLLSGRFDRRSAWLDLVGSASRSDRRVATRGGPIDLRRGELLGGSLYLADRWGWTRKQVRVFLGSLVDRGWLTRGPAKGQYAATFFVVGFDRYQRIGALRATERATERASEGPHPN